MGAMVDEARGTVERTVGVGGDRKLETGDWRAGKA